MRGRGGCGFTCAACCRRQTADLQRRHARLANGGGMRVVPEDYMKRAARFKVVQLHHPLHPRAAEQSGDGYKGLAAC